VIPADFGGSVAESGESKQFTCTYPTISVPLTGVIV
jgi:hypothetical protein